MKQVILNWSEINNGLYTPDGIYVGTVLNLEPYLTRPEKYSVDKNLIEALEGLKAADIEYQNIIISIDTVGEVSKKTIEIII